MRVTWTHGVKRKILSAMLMISAVMIVCVIFAQRRSALETEQENQKYREEHSLFEDIVIGGRLMQGSPASGVSLNKAGGNPDADTSAGRQDSSLSGQELKEDLLEEKRAQADPVRQETFLLPAGEGRWEFYAAGDFADRSYLYFKRFQTLRLSRIQEEDNDLSSEDANIFNLHSGDIIPEACLENGSVWHAQVLGNKEKILEEADLVVYCAGRIPTLFINTESGGLDALDSDQSVREQCRYLICRADGSRDCSGRCEIHGRGNSSWKEDKKQYSVNFASERSVLGMQSSRKFALIANTSDPSFLRNKITFDLAALSRMPASPQAAFVNVYFNGRYHGLYLMAQRPNAKGGSVHIAQLEKMNRAAAGQHSDEQAPAADTGTVTVVDDEGLEIHACPQEKIPKNISGGYLLEMDARYEEEDYWFSTQKHHFVVKYPEQIPLKECEYIAGYLREAEAALYSEDGINADTGKSWEEYFDTDSWAAMYLMQDFMAQWDVESFSFFIYKNADDPLLYCGPVWDFDLSMGATGLGKLPNVMRQSDWLRGHREGWLTELEKFPAFSDALEIFAEDRFFPLLEEYLSEDSALSGQGLQDYMTALAPSVKMDACRWDESDRFEEESARLLTWLKARADFWQGYRENPSAYCKVTLRYGFSDMDIYLPRGEEIGFVPTEEYGEHLYSSFRKKYGSVDGWHCEDGSLLTPQTVINYDQVMTPFSDSQ